MVACTSLTTPVYDPARADTRVVYTSQRPPWSSLGRPVAENATPWSGEHSALSDGPPERDTQYGVFPQRETILEIIKIIWLVKSPPIPIIFL